MARTPGHDRYGAVTDLPDDAAANVPFHDPEDPSADRITVEVLRNRLEQINAEQGTALKRVSGSPIITDAYDFDVTVADERGETVSFGPYVMFHASVTDLIIKWILTHRADNPGIEPGDMFICNDPWTGAVHQNDAVVLAPVFHDGELFSWVSAAVHQVDVGGNEIGSFAVEDDDAFAEAEPVPPTKLVEDGELRADVEDVFLRKSRAPALVGMDLRARIAGKRRNRPAGRPDRRVRGRHGEGRDAGDDGLRRGAAPEPAARPAGRDLAGGRLPGRRAGGRPVGPRDPAGADEGRRRTPVRRLGRPRDGDDQHDVRRDARRADDGRAPDALSRHAVGAGRHLPRALL